MNIPSTLLSTLTLFSALGSVQRDLSFLPSAKEAGSLDRSNGAPYDAEVEYLESTGTQYIDTEFAATVENVEYYLKVQKTSSSVSSLIGAQQTTSWYWSGILYGDSVYVGNSSFKYSLNLLNLNEITLSIIGGNFTLSYQGGILKTEAYTGSITSCTRNIFLFCNNVSGSASQFSSCKVFSFKIKENGILIRDMIPVVKDGVGYMYDRVSGRLFGNSGTGTFTVGPITHVVNRKVSMGKKELPDNNVSPLQMAMPPPVTTVASTNMTNTVSSVTKGN